MYSPIQYCVWTRLIKIPETYERRNSNDLRIHPNIEKWMERVEILQVFTTLQILAEIQKTMPETQCGLQQFIGRVYYGCQSRDRICKRIRARTLVVSRTWIRKELLRNSHIQVVRRMGSYRWGYEDQLQWKRTSRVSWTQCFRTRIFTK